MQSRPRFLFLAGAGALATILCGVVPAAAQGTFTPTGSLLQARDLHTATPLPDGTVLVAAGNNRFASFDALNTAEIYDPATGLFTFTANTLAQGRAQHTATPLAGGKVLLAGGETQACCTSTGSYGSRPLASAEVYDPVSRAFSSTANPMSTVRYNHAATRLADGRVLITGGVTDINIVGFGITAAADIYDPATNTFSSTGSMTIARYGHASALLPDGRVLIVGGPQSSTSAEIFDPATGTFTSTSAPLAASTPTGFSLPDGSVLLAGPARRVQKYDPVTHTFSAMPDTLHNHAYWAAKVMLSDNRLLLADDFHSEIYDPATGASIDTGNPGVGDLFPAGAALSGGRALLTGGQNFVPFTFISQHAATIFNPNAAPVADAGNDQQVSPAAGCVATVTLDATSSSDAEGHTLTYEWTEGATVLGSAATITVSLGAGVHTISVTVDDGQGGASSDTVIVTVADTTAPVFTTPPAVLLEQAGPSGTVYSPLMPAAVDNCDASPLVTVSGVPAGSMFPGGVTTLTYEATDADGNASSSTASVTVADTTRPVITVPAGILAAATSPAGAAVSYAVSATDAVTAAPAIACAPASGSVFPIGATLVQCSATDDAGNTAAGSFTVTVRDAVAPTIVSITPSVSSLWSPNHRMVPVSITVNAADDVTLAPACTITGVASTDPVTGRGDNTSPDWNVTGPVSVDLRAERLGNSSGRIYTVTVKCVDASGNTARGTTAITVAHDKRK